MSKSSKIFFLALSGIGAVLCLLALSLTVRAQTGSVATPTGSPVTVDNKTIFEIHEGYFSYTAADRAKAIGLRIQKLSREPKSRIESLRANDSESVTEIAAGDLAIMTLTEADAKAAGRTRSELAASYAQIIRNAAEELQRQYSFKTILIGLLWALLSTAVLGLLLKIIGLLFRKVKAFIEGGHGTFIRSVRIQKLELLPAERIVALLIVFARLLRAALVVVLLYAYVSVLFSFFPWTREYSDVLLGYIVLPLRVVGGAFVSFVPNIFFIIVILIVSYYLTKFVRFIFNEIEKETIALPNFYSDWASPTYKIVRFLIIAFTGVVIFPYLPGAKSPAFQGVSIFLGVLFSLGSTSAVSNVVAGTVLTYTRAFQLGDRVQIGDAVGDVTGKTLLVTRIRTIKNVDISIPNSMVLGAHIINFSSSASETGLILHTTATIGYDAPWRTVHKLMIEAALSTENILTDPKPFVLQTSLDDFYVSYQLNAYTHQPAVMARTYSDLHQNIQDKFNEAGVEILSPHYGALRDGNQIGIPESYVPKDYQAPSFRIRSDASKPQAKEQNPPDSLGPTGK